MRVRDVIADNTKTFEIQKLENFALGMRDCKNETRGSVIMRLECQSEDEKDDWVRAINMEVKQLRFIVKQFGKELQ